MNTKLRKSISVILMIGVIIYDLSPIDLIPDITPIIGFLDDLALTVGSVINLYISFRQKS